MRSRLTIDEHREIRALMFPMLLVARFRGGSHAAAHGAGLTWMAVSL